VSNLEALDPALAAQFAPLRQLIVETAAALPQVGVLEESLKWGEPSYTPQKKNTGSSVRIAPRKDGRVALHFICHTGLLDEFRELYPHLEFEGKRGIIVDLAKPLPTEELRHCIGLALTYFIK
jgi:Domain of unknown function (DU1801)